MLSQLSNVTYMTRLSVVYIFPKVNQTYCDNGNITFRRLLKSTRLMPWSTKGFASVLSKSCSPDGKVKIVANTAEFVKGAVGNLKRTFSTFTFHSRQRLLYWDQDTISYLKHCAVEIMWFAPPQLMTSRLIHCITRDEVGA